MTTTAKHYVSVAQAVEMLLISERSVRRWIALDPPLLHSIKDSTGHTLVDLDDILAIQEQKPELKNPLPERVEVVEERVEVVEDDVQTLKDEVKELKELKEQIGTLLAALKEGGAPAAAFVRRERASPASGAEARGYPAGTIRLIDFTDEHQLSISEIKELHWQQTIAVTIYEREHAKRNAREWWITPEQHRAVVAYYQQRQLPIRTETCDICSAAS
ncbi:MAG TPA: hypothetical protein VFN35_04890 [Ktedonobacteraceae bacterium]|nr:hypothetical protein [Ktedonobacteraceae bacterium]